MPLDTTKESTKIWQSLVFACVPNPGEQSIWRQCPPSARKQSTKKLPNRPGFAHVHVKEEGRGTRNGYEASKGSKGISGL